MAPIKKDRFFIFFSTFALIFLTTNISRFWVDSSFEDSGSILKQIVGSIFILYLIIALIRNKSTVFYILKTNKLFTIISILMIISLMWSQDTFLTFKRLIMAISFHLFTLLVFSKKDSLNLLRRIFFLYFIIVTCFCIISMLSPYGWMQYENQGFVPKGIFYHKNYFGRFLCLSILFYLCEIYKYKKLHIIFCSVSLALLLLTKSSASLLICIAFSVVFLITFKKKILKVSFFIVSFLFLVYHIYSSISLWNFGFQEATDLVLNSVEKDRNLNGRSRLWDLLIADGLKNNPLLGAGYSGYFKNNSTHWLELMDEFAPGHAHNSYIQIFLELGLIGLGMVIYLILLSIINSFKELHKGIKNPKFYISLSFLAIVTFGFFEPGILGYNHVMSCLFLMGVIKSA